MPRSEGPCRPLLRVFAMQVCLLATCDCLLRVLACVVYLLATLERTAASFALL